MSWAKRNLSFLISAIVALALLGLAGYYCYSKWELNNQNREKLKEAYADWTRIVGLAVNPGNEKVDNITNSREQQQKARDKSRDVRRYFVMIPPIPDPAEVTARQKDFASAFRSDLLWSIKELQKDAANNGVQLNQPNYNFSFKKQNNQYNFNPASLGPLSVQLGEVKMICGVLFRAKINSLDNLQRERVSADDLEGPPSDYLEPSMISVTNELAVLTPYVITFNCFSAELASVLTGFASDPRGVIVKAINVEPASSPTGGSAEGMGMAMAGGFLESRMGGTPGAAPAAAPTARGGLPTILDEKPLRVTLVLTVVKLLPKK